MARDIMPMDATMPLKGRVKKGKSGDAGMDDTSVSVMPNPKNPVAKQLKSGTIHPKDLMQKISKAYSCWLPIFVQSEADINFTYFDQWEDIRRRGKQSPTPDLEINFTKKYVEHVIGTFRKNKMSVKVSGRTIYSRPIPVHNMKKTLTQAEVVEGIMRDIEIRSDAPMAYARGGQHAVEGGFGWFHIDVVQDKDDPFSDEVKIKHVKDKYSVLMDPSAEMPDFSDANWGIISRKMNIHDFKARYPGFQTDLGSGTISTFGIGSHSNFSGWMRDDESVRVMDYYWKEPMTRVAIQLFNEQNGEELVVWEDDVKEVIDELGDDGFEEVKRMKVKTHKVKYCRMTAMDLLVEPLDWPGMMIPLVPVFGRQIEEGNITHYMSLTNGAKDPQRMVNVFASSSMEKIATEPRGKWIAPASTIAGQEHRWNNADDETVLLYNPTDEGLKPERIEGAKIPTADLTMFGLAKDMFSDVIGMPEASLGEKSNETSGKAISNRQEASSNNTAEFMDNLAYAVKGVGNVCTDLIPNVYGDKKVTRIILDTGNEAMVSLARTIEDKESGKTMRVADLKLQRYTTVVSVTNASISQNDQFIEMIVSMAKGNPQMLQMYMDMIIEAGGFPNGKAMADRARRAIPRHLLTEEETQDMPPEQPSPEAQAAQVDMEKKNLELQGESEQLDAKGVILDKEIRLAEAKTTLALAELEKGGEGEKGGEMGMTEQEIVGLVKKIVAESLAA